MPGNSGNGSWFNLYNNAMLRGLTNSPGRQMKTTQRRFTVLSITFTNISSVIIDCDSSAFPAALGSRRRRSFHATNKFATRTHVERTIDPSLDRGTIAKLSQNSLTHADQARPSTSNTIRAIRLRATTTSDERTQSLAGAGIYSVCLCGGAGAEGADFKRP